MDEVQHFITYLIDLINLSILLRFEFEFELRWSFEGDSKSNPLKHNGQNFENFSIVLR